MNNVYKVYIDDTARGDVEVWTIEAANPSSAIVKVMRRTSFGKSADLKSFAVSAELAARDMHGIAN